MISIKVVLVGATKCGKTCLAKRIAEDKDITSTPYVATVFDNYSKSLTIGGTPVIAGIWDTAGPEDYDRLRPLSYPATHLFIICADQSAPINTTDLTKWQKEYTLHIPNAQVAVVGCKSDLPDKSSAALQKWAAALPAKNFVGFYSVSAKTNDGIAAMLEGALTKCMATNQALLKERGGKPVSKAAPAPRSKAASKKKADSSDSEASEKPLKAKKESAAKDKAAGSDDEAAASKEEKAVDPNFTPSGKKAVLQVCLLGDKGVGKTSFALTAKSGVHMTRPTPPGGEVIEVHTTADDSFVETPCKVFLTDTDASSSYDRIRPFSYAGADAFIVLFSAVSPHSLKRAHTFWVPSIRETGTKAPIWLVGTKGDLREDVVTNEALANAGERPIEKKDAEKQSKAMKLKGYFEVNTLVAKDVRKALSEVIGAIWDAADDKKKAKAAAPKVKNADLEKQLLDLGNDLSEGRITFEQWEARVKEVSETEQANAEARHKARRLFNKVDADKSGTVDAEEFAALAQELGGGEAWSEEELADAFKQIDKDGSGAIDFEEFFAWLNAPATYAKSNAKLEALRAQATLRQVKAKSKAVATSLGAGGGAAILAPPKSTKIDLKVSVGRDFTAASGIDISMLHDSHYADEVRSRVNAEFTDIVVSLGFGIRPDVDDFAVGEVSGLIREGILMAAKKAKFQIAEIRNQIVTIDGQRVFRVNFSFDSRIDPSLQDGIHAALIVRELAVAINFAEQPGKQTAKGAAGKFSVAVLGEVALSEDVLRSAMKIDPGSASGLRKGLVSSKDGSDADESDESDNELAAEVADILGEKKGNPLLGLKILRSLETDLVFEDLAGLLPPGVQLFRMLKPLLLSSLVEAFGKPGSETLFAGFAHFDTLHSLTVCGGENALLLTTRNMTLFDLFPTMAEVARAKADSKGEDPFKVFMKAGESEKGDGSDSDSDGEDEAAADTERGANEYRGTDELQHLMAVSSDPKLISSLAKASIYDVYHKNTNWQVNADDDSQFGETLQLVADRGMKLYAKFDMQPGTYLPYLRVKLDGKVKAPKLKVKSKWVEGDDDKKCDDTVSADALKVLKDNKWHEVRLSVEPVTLSKPTSVKLKCASAVSTSWIKGVTVDWIGFKRLMPRPRIAQLRAQGVCTRDEDLQACYFFATAAEARRQYATSDCASEGVCGACADKCAPEGKKAVFYTDIAMFKCNCAAASCQCRATPLRKDSPSSVYPAVPKGYVLQANTLRRAVAAKVPAMAFADWPAPATGVTYFEVHVHDGGKANEIGVGLCEGARLGVNMFPGWRYHSFGFHGDNGLLYMGQGTEKSQKGHAEIEARPFGKGDTVGCGYDPEHKQVFFTLNGKLTPACFSEVPGEPQYFPVVTLLGLGATVEVNFGAQPFRYDVAQWAPRSAGDSLCTAIAFGL